MNKPKTIAEDFIDFLVATPVNATAMEARWTNPVGSGEPSQDAYTRLLHRLEPTRGTLAGPEYLFFRQLVLQPGEPEKDGCCRVAMADKAQAQRLHIGLALRAFLVFERYNSWSAYNLVATKGEDLSGSRSGS